MFKSIGEAASGIPKRPTRRGRSGSKGKSVGSAGAPSDHLNNLTNALNANDHGKARSHAFALVRSLPKAQMGQPLPNDLPDASGPADATGTGTDDGPKLAPAAPAFPSRLASAMKGMKK